MKTNYLKDIGPSLIEKGYRIAPVQRGAKHPGLLEWNELHANEGTITEWLNIDTSKWVKNKNPFTEISVITEEVVGVDLDIMDPKIADKIYDFCIENYGKAPKRIGQKPKMLLVYRTEEPFTKMSSITYEDFFGEEQRIEILGKGQQFLAYAEHPKTLKPYKWSGGPGLSDLPLEELSLFNRSDAQKLLDYFEEIRPREWERKTRSVNSKLSTSTTATSEWDSVVPKANIDKKEATKALNLIHECADDRDTWINVGKAIHHQFDGSDEGLEIFDEWSQHSSKYGDGRDGLPKDKWRGFYSIPNGKRPVTFAYVLKLKKETLARARRSKQVEDLKKARGPNAGGYLSENNKLDELDEEVTDLDSFLERYIYVKKGRLVHDLKVDPQVSMVSLEEFRDYTSNIRHEVPVPNPPQNDPERTKALPVHSSWMVHTERQSAYGLGYSPFKGRIYTSATDQQSYINTFNVPKFPKEDAFFGNIDVFLEHMNYLIPHKSERKWFIDWLAFIVQRPKPRCKVHPLHISVAHGTGRGWVVELIRKLLGDWNCTTTKMAELCGEGSSSAFNEYLNESLLCAVEEVKETSKRYTISTKIRSMLTELTYNINIKSGAKTSKEVFTNFFFMSNHVDALVLTEDDRRIQVLSGPKEPKENGYYERIYTWSASEQNIAALYLWLSGRDISAFNWKRSTHTPGRARMIDSTRTATETAFMDFLKDTGTTAILYQDVINKVQAFMEGDAFGNTADSNQILKLLQHHGDHSVRLKFNSKAVRPWLLGKWEEIDNKKVREELQKHETES